MMVTNFEVRYLLVLWDLGGSEVRKGELNGRFSGRTAEANDACASLLDSKKIKTSDGKLLTLTDAGKALLGESLAGDGFEFEAQIGVKMANALLKWWRSQSSVGAIAAGQGDAISSYEAFKSVALETFNRLNKGSSYGGLVPIWHTRQEIGAAVSRTQFNDWIMQMQAEQIFYLQTGEAIGATDSQKRDSIENEIRGLLFYISQPD